MSISYYITVWTLLSWLKLKVLEITHALICITESTVTSINIASCVSLEYSFSLLRNTCRIRAKISHESYTCWYYNPGIQKIGYTATSWYFLQQNPSSEASSCLSNRCNLRILWKPKIHHRIHTSPQSVPSLSHINLAHTLPSPFFKIYICPIRATWPRIRIILPLFVHSKEIWRGSEFRKIFIYSVVSKPPTLPLSPC
jgi:hypothetical protein